MIPIYWQETELNEQGEGIVQRIGARRVDLPKEGWALVLTPERLALQPFGEDASGPVFVDFVGGKQAHRRQFGGGRGQPLARAIGMKKGHNPTLIDATAGLGRDAFVLATLGATVTLVERSPVVAELLRDGLARAAQEPDLADIVARMTLIHGNAIQTLQSLPEHEVVYLDPMYPHRDKSALVKKEMRLLREVVGDDPDTPDLLSAARQAAGKRVVVKRPNKAPFLGDQVASSHIPGKTTRYDLYPT